MGNIEKRGVSRLIVAPSGLGKSFFARQHPARVFDGDLVFYEALAEAWPGESERARAHHWRRLCRLAPWAEEGPDLETWARTRRRFTQSLTALLSSGRYRLVLTSLLNLPWPVHTFYAIERGRYLEHLERVGRPVDNYQSEGMNLRMEGYAPLIRLAPGEWLSDRPELQALL